MLQRVRAAGGRHGSGRIQEFERGESVERFGLIGALVLISIAWGTTIPLTKVAVSTGHHPLGLIFWQFTFGALILGAVALLRGTSLRLTRPILIFITIIAFIGTILPNSMSNWAAFHLPAGVMGLNIAAVPMFVLAGAWLMRIEAPEWTRFLGVLFGVLAILLVVGPEASLPDPAKAPFVFIALLAPLCYGFEGNFIARHAPRDLDPLDTLLGASILGVLIMGPVTLATGTFVAWPGPMTVVEWAMVASAFSHTLAYAGFFWLIPRAGPVFTGQIAYLVTINAVLFSMIFLGERYSWWIWAAFALMLTGIALVQPRRVAREDGA